MRFRALQLRSQLPVLEPIPANPEGRIKPPTQGSPPANIQLGYRWNRTLGDGVELGYRAAYHDLLGNEAGHLSNSGLAVFDLRVWRAGERIKLLRFDFFRAESLNPNETGLPGDGGLAWRLVFGAERAHLGCVDCLYGHLTGGLGKAAYLGTERIVGYAMAQPSLISRNEFTGSAGISAVLGFTVRVFDGWMARLEGGYGWYLDSLGNGSFFSFENRFGSAQSWDVRLTVEREVETETALGLVYYW